jgi:serine/threonine protein phosphatase PrpC
MLPSSTRAANEVITGRTGSSGGIRVGAAQMQGKRDYMEDCYSFHPGTRSSASSSSSSTKTSAPTIVGCYDGHGGDQTSNLLASEFPRHLQQLSVPLDAQELCAAFLRFDNVCVWQERKGVAELIQGAAVAAAASPGGPWTTTTTTKSSTPLADLGWGSTCVVALLDPVAPGASSSEWNCAVAHVGDSRAYVLRANGVDGHVLTRDHKPSLRSEHERISSAGGFVTHDRVDGNLNMSRSFADSTYKRDARLPDVAQKVIAVPDVAHLRLSPGDALLLCSDGVTESLKDADILQQWRQLAASHQSPVSIAATLVHSAYVKGSSDNITVVIVDVLPYSGLDMPMRACIFPAC